MITTFLLGADPVKVSPGWRRRWVHIANRSDSTVNLKYDGGETVLTVDNGIPLAAGAVLMLEHSGHDQEFFHDVWALYGVAGAKLIVIHEG